MSEIINLNYLKEISGGDTNFIKEMLELYITTTATEAVLFHELYAQKDISGIGHLAHKMKAPIQMLGATDLYNTIKTIEESCKTGLNLELLPGNIDRVNQLVNESVTEVKGLIDNL
ncbi:MAG: Hpt domain-containing protein [Bacteroidia bacterium]|nr:Hpt domain-containing protein [Bacteroidia bacterium]